MWAVVICLLTTLGCAVSRTQTELPTKRVTRIEFESIKELKEFRGKIKKDLRITVGGFNDKTGQFKDSTTLRYSKAMTQGAQEVLYHMLYKALGPKLVVEREPENFARLTQEYRFSYVKGPRTGVITKGGPEGGLVGANYMVAGAIIYYHVDRYSGGGGINIEGIGGHYRTAIARISIELRLIDMSTSEIYWSTIMESWVSGTKIGIDIYRFLTAGGNEYLVSAEAGLAAQLPADYAFQICLSDAVVSMIKENKGIFLTETAAKEK
jgi:Uncharacterized protein involved in formation of curli polymers